MIKTATYRFYYFLIISCLGLLITFLTLWNFKVYQDEVAQLQKTTSLSFVNMMQHLEGDVLRKQLFHSSDKKEIRTLLYTEEGNFVNGKSFQEIEVESEINQPRLLKEELIKRGDLKGVISLKWSNDISDSAKKMPFSLDSVMFAIIKDSLISTVDAEFDIIKINGESQKNGETHFEIFTPTYQDLLTGETYMGYIKEYQWKVIKSIWGQILFSFILLGAISAAFMLMLRTMKKQERLAAIKNDFVSNMTHELKTPITTVNLALEALSNFNALADAKKTEEYIDISKKELNRLSILVDKVLKMSVFEETSLDLKLEFIDMKQLVSEVVQSMKIHFEKFGGEHQLTFLGENFILKGDKIHLTSVIYNLIDNALKYSPQNPKVSILVESQEEKLLFSVQDNGLGIEKAFQSKVFDKFFRVPTGDNHTIKGHGLGLSYVATVIKQHQGNIKLESKPMEGSTFIVTLNV